LVNLKKFINIKKAAHLLPTFGSLQKIVISLFYCAAPSAVVAVRANFDQLIPQKIFFVQKTPCE